MTSYQIISTATGTDLGTYEAHDEQCALEAMARDAGYRSHADLLDATGSSADDVRVTERR
jgi:hypothetical protein